MPHCIVERLDKIRVCLYSKSRLFTVSIDSIPLPSQYPYTHWNVELEAKNIDRWPHHLEKERKGRSHLSLRTRETALQLRAWLPWTMEVPVRAVRRSLVTAAAVKLDLVSL